MSLPSDWKSRPEDYFTNTVEDARDFEAYFAYEEKELVSPEEYLDCEDENEDDYYNGYDGGLSSCNCSDPCCPCDGKKNFLY